MIFGVLAEDSFHSIKPNSSLFQRWLTTHRQFHEIPFQPPSSRPRTATGARSRPAAAWPRGRDARPSCLAPAPAAPAAVGGANKGKHRNKGVSLKHQNGNISMQTKVFQKMDLSLTTANSRSNSNNIQFITQLRSDSPGRSPARAPSSAPPSPSPAGQAAPASPSDSPPPAGPPAAQAQPVWL